MLQTDTLRTAGRAQTQPALVLTLGATPNLAAVRALLGTLAWPAGDEAAGDPGRLTLVFPGHPAAEVLDSLVRLLKLAAAQNLPCSAALVSGEVLSLQAAGQAARFVGAALDRAGQLADLAGPGRLLADPASLATAGVLATAPAWLGEARQDPVSGAADALTYHEVGWLIYERPTPAQPSARPRRARAAPAQLDAAGEDTAQPASGAPSRRPAAAPARDARARTEPSQTSWIRGTILRLGRRFGFIEGAGGQLYYFQPSNLTLDAPLRRGGRVVFRALPPLRGTQEPRAEDVFVLDAVAEGVVERLDPRGWGLLRLDCKNGLEHRLFIQNLGAAGVRAGQTVRCRLGANRMGPVGYEPAPVG